MIPFLLSHITLFSGLFLGFVSGHVYVESWTTDSYKNWQSGQKSWKLSDTAYRPAPDNIGWVGSKFLTANRAIVCSASNTPRGTVAPSGGRFFSDAAYSAGKTLRVNAGGKISLLLRGDKGGGYPHFHGHVLVYLGKCGDSPTACQSFDASTASFFKIQQVIGGVTTLRKQYSSTLGGDVWTVRIPTNVSQGSYIFRFEIITWGESVASEGFQDQYYPSCGQIYVQSSKHRYSNHKNFMHLPGAYRDGNLKSTSIAPGPALQDSA